MKKKINLLLLPVLLVLLVLAIWLALQRREPPVPYRAELSAVKESDPGISSLEERSGENDEDPEPTPAPTPTPAPRYVRVIEENALQGSEPDPAGYHESMDNAELSAFLQREDVCKLTDGRQLVWNEKVERFPDTPLRWYFDDTILCIVWQEVEAQAVGTFSEIIVADGSQLRRKISADELWSFAFETTSQFAEDTRAVLAFGGDFYYHGRACGIGFYQRELYRFDPVTCDTCYVTGDGDLLFSYRGQFQEQSEAETFAKENDVLFSLGFGPVLIDEGQDVTPESYLWGEVDDTYARSALGLLDRHHYLTMNINCWQPGTTYYNLATLREAADAMLARGCWKAYALDGGQTATTVFGGTLVNPVQFGWEKEISDIIYFASARDARRIELPPE